MNEFVWIDLDMAVDFLAGLCFPRAAGELLVASAFPAGIFALLSYQQLEAITYIKPMFMTTMKKSERV